MYIRRVLKKIILEIFIVNGKYVSIPFLRQYRRSCRNSSLQGISTKRNYLNSLKKLQKSNVFA